MIEEKTASSRRLIGFLWIAFLLSTLIVPLILSIADLGPDDDAALIGFVVMGAGVMQAILALGIKTFLSGEAGMKRLLKEPHELSPADLQLEQTNQGGLKAAFDAASQASRLSYLATRRSFLLYLISFVLADSAVILAALGMNFAKQSHAAFAVVAVGGMVLMFLLRPNWTKLDTFIRERSHTL